MAKKNKKNLSIIDAELEIEGSISSSGKLIIKGKVNGTMEGDVVVIAENGEVYSTSADISSMTIGGKFEGNIRASKELVILSTGSCSGKVECKDLIVENGGLLNAEVSCISSSQVESAAKKNKKEVKTQSEGVRENNGKIEL